MALLDVNVLVALFDPDHIHHEAAHRWFGRERRHGWATSAMTENGLIRGLSNPSYSTNAERPAEVAARLAHMREGKEHTFWTEAISLCDEAAFDLRLLSGHGQLTDAFLLGLSVAHRGRLATFDRTIPLGSVCGALPEHLVLIPA